MSLEELDNVVGGSKELGVECESNIYVRGCIAKAYSINTDICDIVCIYEKKGKRPSKADIDALVKLDKSYEYLYDVYDYR